MELVLRAVLFRNILRDQRGTRRDARARRHSLPALSLDGLLRSVGDNGAVFEENATRQEREAITTLCEPACRPRS